MCLQVILAASRSFRRGVRRLPLPHVRLPHWTTRSVRPSGQHQPRPGVDVGWRTGKPVEAEETHRLRGSKRPGITECLLYISGYSNADTV